MHDARVSVMRHSQRTYCSRYRITLQHSGHFATTCDACCDLLVGRCGTRIRGHRLNKQRQISLTKVIDLFKVYLRDAFWLKEMRQTSHPEIFRGLTSGPPGGHLVNAQGFGPKLCHRRSSRRSNTGKCQRKYNRRNHHRYSSMSLHDPPLIYPTSTPLNIRRFRYFRHRSEEHTSEL